MIVSLVCFFLIRIVLAAFGLALVMAGIGKVFLYVLERYYAKRTEGE